MPGVLVVEAMAQIAAVLVSFRPDFDRIAHWCYGVRAAGTYMTFLHNRVGS
jgi:3-hydroxymyristoyl/3-hydroxydecanoyl-(acyl carrier protein) dehydratase